ncbi:uncharacterized protein K444DRAFT_719080 [Hyaloscypha bicolor E]|uniref:TLC domain-containing protein n=1 Tax=Hyaloscypha bicolor E TaxID=1095630 RepID=A0A2J6TDK7_9HELO|nr:uncharacterized protein K444DRAFT_719080 [Hyaloscypha bicolor E]PMD61072.1 hypothetical protein K444DRAFT_719080 [Hyaloscypha bicolor E]
MPHINFLPIETISKLASLSSLILVIVLVCYFFICYYVFQPLIPRIYGSPFLSVTFGTSTFHSALVHGHNPMSPNTVIIGDILVVAAHMLVGMYAFELFYRDRISPVSVLHHIGTIIIAETSIALSLGKIQESDAGIEFMLYAFDIVAEFLPRLALILYRLHPTSPHFLSKLFRITACTELDGTISETAVTMWLFGSLWHRWTLPFKIVTPLLHILFAAAQLRGSYVFWRLWQREKAKVAGLDAADVEMGREGHGGGGESTRDCDGEDVLLKTLRQGMKKDM